MLSERIAVAESGARPVSAVMLERLEPKLKPANCVLSSWEWSADHRIIDRGP